MRVIALAGGWLLGVFLGAELGLPAALAFGAAGALAAALLFAAAAAPRKRWLLAVLAVAGAPVVDWDGYDTGYTERYLSTPQDNPEGYREGAVTTHVEGLTGKLLLVHGMVDENVHFRHTARLITALTAAQKPYDIQIFPEERHMPRDAAGLEYMERRLVSYFEEHLLA